LANGWRGSRAWGSQQKLLAPLPRSGAATDQIGSTKLELYPNDAKGAVATTPETGQWNTMTGSADFATVPGR
jgi:hypothetical protein